jgi:hypothetical protein
VPKFQITPEIVVELVARVPEGFIHKAQLAQRYNSNYFRNNAIREAAEQGLIGRDGAYLFDKTRLNVDQLRELVNWASPVLPLVNNDGKFAEPSIYDRMKNRARQFNLHDNSAYASVFEQFTQNKGFFTQDEIASHPDEPIFQNLVHAGGLDVVSGYIYDPLRVSVETMRVIAMNQLPPISHNGDKHGNKQDNEVVIVPSQPQAAKRIKDTAWEESLQLSGDIVRRDLRDGKSRRARVLARTYVLSSAAKLIGIAPETLEIAVHEGRVAAFTDPEGKMRIPAAVVEMAEQDSVYAEQIATYEVMKIREIATVCGSNYPNVRKRLARAGINRSTPRWSEIRGRWGLPATLKDFRAELAAKMETRKLEMAARLAEEERRFQERRQKMMLQREVERKQRQELRAKLVAAFPSWRHDGRADQRIVIHVGPPNSGKTHHALEALAQASSGWYLAPLRLLAFEIFDRLNRQGVFCNLLTGEEYIPIPGATITAATIEMFDPRNSGDVVIIDEAQMLADPDRGWAWTRAIMEAQSPEIRVICPPTASKLIEQMATAAAIPCNIETHERLAPIKVADNHMSLENLPPRTILVAFSRQNVLQLKNELERMKRSVSVIYGNLPPEVRRKQADRFAVGQTDICVATDAVGMGLNLPADYVVFYELQKFDGKKVRVLTSSEVQQIGGRAGRFGLSRAGEVGAMTKRDLRVMKQLFHAPQAALTHARVAPTVDDLEMIPGSLAEKLAQWAALQSVPESLKSAIRTADLSERIELARMLTDDEVNYLGLGTAMKLINAPTRQTTRGYWYQCTRTILKHCPMPLPQQAPLEVLSASDLEAIENCVSCADIYLWLSCRPEFMAFAPDSGYVREKRAEWSEEIDLALLNRIDTARRCAQCGKPLPANYRYAMCNACYYGRYQYREDKEFSDHR